MIKLGLKEKIKSLIHTGFFFVIVSQVIAKLVSFVSSIILARILSKEDYGFYAYAANLISVCLLLDGIGTISSMLQFGSAASDELSRTSYSSFGFIIGQTFNTGLSIVILFIGLFSPLSMSDARILLIAMAFQPVFSYAISYFSINLRMRMLTKTFSVMNIVITVISLLSMTLGGIIYGAMGVIIATYIGYFIGIIIYMAIFIKYKLKAFDKKIVLNKKEKFSFVKMSLSSTCNDAILHLVMVADLFIIGLMIAEPAVSASYKIATTIPSALVFIPSSVMVYAFPYFAKHQNEKKWVVKNYLYLIGGLGAINFLIVLLCFILAPWIVTGIFGKQYADSVTYFRILMLGYFFNGTVRAPTTNVLWSQKKGLSVVLLACIMGGVNIVMDILLIRNYQAAGAAYATLITYFVAAVVSVGLLVWHLAKGNKKGKNISDSKIAESVESETTMEESHEEQEVSSENSENMTEQPPPTY